MLKTRLSYLFKHNWLRKFENFLVGIGAIWLSIEFPSFLIPSFEKYIKDNNISTLIIALSISVLYAFIKDWPKVEITKTFKASNTSICIKVGDIFTENDNIIMGSSDYFDTTFRRTDVSLKSKMINLYFQNSIPVLDNLMNTSLSNQRVFGQLDTTRTVGKNVKYPIGTTVVIPVQQKRIFLTIITNLLTNSQGTTTKSSPEKLNLAINSLWKQLKNEGRMEEISIPVLGSGLAGVTLSRLMIIQSIIMSFAIFSKETRITTKLKIIIAEKDYDPDDFEHACKYLESIQF